MGETLTVLRRSQSKSPRMYLTLGCFVYALGIWPVQARASTIINYPSFNFTCGTNGLTCTGNASDTGGVLQLTPATGNQAGAAYSTTAVPLGVNDTFSTQFQFQFTNPGGVDPADGIVFVLAANPNGLGTSGFGLGYAGVANSVGIELDTYDNGNANSLGFFSAEPDSSNHVAIDSNGVLTDTSPVNVYGNGSCGFAAGAPAQNPNTAAGCMSNGDIWTAVISYDGSTQSLSMALSDPAMGTTFPVYNNLSFDLASLLGTNTAYVGFTASTGAGWENHDILNWALNNTAASTVPEPSSPLLVISGAIVLALLARRRSGAARQTKADTL
jgi:Legume lectin domain